MYGLGTNSLAEQLKISKAEAEEIINSFYREFPTVKTWMDNTKTFAHKNGYVTDVWGRRRRLPDIKRPKYEVKANKETIEFNPLLHTSGCKLDDSKIDLILKELNNCKWRSDVDKVKQTAKSLGYNITDNTGFISRAERQCVNARIQGGAASMSKRAMVRVANNSELNELGFRLLIAVHDELIGECPIENQDRCKELLSNEMLNSALPEVTVPMKCDADCFPSWYYDVYSAEIKKEFDKNGKDFEKLCYNHTELLPNQLESIINEF